MTGLFNRLPTVWREAVEELWRRRLRTLLTPLACASLRPVSLKTVCVRTSFSAA